MTFAVLRALVARTRGQRRAHHQHADRVPALVQAPRGPSDTGGYLAVRDVHRHRA